MQILNKLITSISVLYTWSLSSMRSSLKYFLNIWYFEILYWEQETVEKQLSQFRLTKKNLNTTNNYQEYARHHRKCPMYIFTLFQVLYIQPNDDPVGPKHAARW
jgi:hypothetical protein